MPRTPRTEIAGGIHHVTNRGNRKQRIFYDDQDRSFFLRQLATAAKRYGWVCLAHCLMSNHFHLVIETPVASLGLGMQYLEGRYALAFNQRHENNGHLFQGRFWSKLVRSDEQFAQLLRYVALNPVAAGLCDDPADWRWSSHRELLSGSQIRSFARTRVEWLLDVWGGEPGARYGNLFDAGHALNVKFGFDSPWTYRPPLDELLQSPGLDEAMRAAREHGYTLREIAAAVGLAASTVCERTRRT